MPVFNCIRLKTFRRFLSPNRGRNLAILVQIWLNFGFKRSLTGWDTVSQLSCLRLMTKFYPIKQLFLIDIRLC